MTTLERIGVSLDKKLLEMYEALIARQGYQNRSEAIRDLIRARLDQDHIHKPAARAVAGIFIIYDHHRAGLTHKLTEMQHHHLLQTIASVHVHLDHHNCLEIIILKGKVRDIKDISNRITALKGIKLSKTAIMTTGEKLP